MVKLTAFGQNSPLTEGRMTIPGLNIISIILKKIIVKSDSDIKNIDDLKGKVLEVQQGSLVLKTINNNTTSLKNSFKEIKEVDGYDTALMNLQSGVCDLVIADSGLAYYLVVEKYPDTKILNENFSYEQLVLDLKKEILN